MASRPAGRYSADDAHHAGLGNGALETAAERALHADLDLAAARFASSAVAMMRLVASSVPMPVFLRLCVSDADTPMQNMLDAARQAALEALLVEHQAGRGRRPGAVAAAP